MKSPVVYMGLFLVALALYALEKTKGGTGCAVTQQFYQASSFSDKHMSVTALEKLQELYVQLSSEPFIKGKMDGIQLAREADAVVIRFAGDEVYMDGEVAIRDNWYSVLDRMAEIIRAEITRGVKVDMRGFADEKNRNERKSGDFGESEYAFSFSRAEWVSRYFEGKWRIPLKGIFSMRGMGAYPNGKKVELSLTY